MQYYNIKIIQYDMRDLDGRAERSRWAGGEL